MDHELSAELMNFEMLYYSHYFFLKKLVFFVFGIIIFIFSGERDVITNRPHIGLVLRQNI